MANPFTNLLSTFFPSTFSPLRHDDPQERRRALEQFCIRHPRSCKAVLLEAIDDVDYSVRERAMELLIERLDPDVVPILLSHLSKNPGERWRAGAIARHSDPGVTEQIVLLLVEHSDPSVRSLIVSILSYLHTDVSRMTLQRLLFDTNEPIELRARCADALAAYEDEQTRESLLHVAHDAEPALREAALHALAKLGERERLLRWIDDQALAVEVRASCIEALPHCLQADEIGLLYPFLADSDSRIRTAAARAMAESYSPNLLTPLVLQLVSSDEPTRRSAVGALETLMLEDIVTPEQVREMIEEECSVPLQALTTLRTYSPRHFA
ncbi:MAG: HEAT repeat domain-containing protein [Myxococcales bacterium]|nr:HEAT repeat domain-containing protein [Myxococcales bacterium]